MIRLELGCKRTPCHLEAPHTAATSRPRRSSVHPATLRFRPGFFFFTFTFTFTFTLSPRRRWEAVRWTARLHFRLSCAALLKARSRTQGTEHRRQAPRASSRTWRTVLYSLSAARGCRSGGAARRGSRGGGWTVRNAAKRSGAGSQPVQSIALLQSPDGGVLTAPVAGALPHSGHVAPAASPASE